MNTRRRRRVARLPRFKPLEELMPGDPFNPYDLFVYSAVRKKLLEDRKLRPGAKLVWLMLADQCASSGHDEHSQANLAGFMGLSRDQFARHLRVLIKRKMVHVEHELGAQNFTWLLYHPLFAGCSPMTPRTNAVRGPAEVQQGVLQNSNTQRNYQRNYQRNSGVDLSPGTSSRGALAPNGELKAKGNGHGEALPGGSDNGYLVSSPVNLRRTPGWYALSPTEKANRADVVGRLVDRIAYHQTLLNDRDAAIARQARHEIARDQNELRALGALPPARKGRSQ